MPSEFAEAAVCCWRHPCAVLARRAPLGSPQRVDPSSGVRPCSSPTVCSTRDTMPARPSNGARSGHPVTRAPSPKSGPLYSWGKARG